MPTRLKTLCLLAALALFALWFFASNPNRTSEGLGSHIAPTVESTRSARLPESKDKDDNTLSNREVSSNDSSQFDDSPYRVNNGEDLRNLWAQLNQQTMSEEKREFLKLQAIATLSKLDLGSCLTALKDLEGPGSDRGKYLAHAVTRSKASTSDIINQVHGLTFEDDLKAIRPGVLRSMKSQFDPDEITSIVGRNDVSNDLKKMVIEGVSSWFSRALLDSEIAGSSVDALGKVSRILGSLEKSEKQKIISRMVLDSASYEPFAAAEILATNPDLKSPQLERKVVVQMALKNPSRTMEILAGESEPTSAASLTMAMDVWIKKDVMAAAEWFNERASSLSPQQHNAAVASFEAKATRWRCQNSSGMGKFV